MKKHLSAFYSYRATPRAILIKIKDKPAEERPRSLEDLIQEHLTRGHELFFQGDHRGALDEYQTAYTLVYRFLHPDFPDDVVKQLPSALRGIDVFDGLLAASGEVARFRSSAGDRPLVAPVDPPPKLLEIINQFGQVGTTPPLSAANHYYRLATEYLRLGAHTEAAGYLQRSNRENGGQDPALDADINAALGVVALQQGETGRASEHLKKAQAANEQLRRPSEAAAVNNNLGVLHTLDGQADAAGAAFQAAGDHMPLGMGRMLTQSLNPGLATAMDRPMGESGLQLLLRAPNADTGWVSVPTNPPPKPVVTQLGVLVNQKVRQIELDGDVVGDLTGTLYEPRQSATSLEDLDIHEELPANFTAYLGHIHAFVLPLAMGDCYYEMGDYEQALDWYQQVRDYAFLNKPIEAPVVWLKMANAYLQSGHQLYREHDKAQAQLRYETIVTLEQPALDPASPLYAAAAFDQMKDEVEAILASPPPVDPDIHNPAVAVVVFVAQLNLENIAAGIDVPLLSFEREDTPVFTFEFLQSVARYFAEHAIQAERTYIQFKTSAEQEEFSRLMLENAVGLERANETLEQKKVDIATSQKAAVDANVAYAQTQLTNAQSAKSEYEQVSLQEIALDSEITYVGAPTTEYDFSGYEGYGVSDGTHRADEVLRTLTQRRREITRDFELHNMDRHISELKAASDIARKQQITAGLQVQAAQMQSQIATLRREQAEQQLAQFDSEEFTPDLWNRLANEIKLLSQSYVDQAIVIAQLMQQSFEFEVGESVGVIKSSYTRNDLSGLLAGDFLLRDIDAFSYMRIVHAQKKQPMKEVVSLADRYPVQFLREFQRTGRMNFRTELDDFDRGYPGSYQQRIKRIEVVVEGLIGRDGIHGTLTNTGLCLTRLRNGDLKQRLLKPETMLLSRYRLGPDSVVFTPDREMLAIFENSPVSTSWVLDLPPRVNDLVYNFITDVKLVMYYESFYDEELKPSVLEELAETQPLTGRRTVALRYELFDEFFVFHEMGEARFTLRDTMLPFHHMSPVLDELTVLIQTESGVSPAGVNVRISAADGASALQTTDADGALSTTPGSQLRALMGHPLLQEWTISIPRDENQAAFDDGFEWAKVENLVLVAEYTFTPRLAPGEPVVLLRDAFDGDPLGDFDVVDDALANEAAPSAWSYNATERRIEQTSDIHGGAAGPADHTPDKPGTYLVRKAGAGPPLPADLIVTCTTQSTDEDGVGLVFRWQDADNFYFFLMDSRRQYRRLGKKVAGVLQELTTPAVDTTAGYVAGRSYRMKVRIQGQSIAAFLDGDRILSGSDASLPNSGRVGFFAWSNAGVSFDNLQTIGI